MTINNPTDISRLLAFTDAARKVYPSLTAGASISSANTDWVYGNYATIVPTITITQDFHILGVSIESCDRDGIIQLELYKGAGDEIVTAVRFALDGGFYGNQVYVVGSGLIDANSQVRARIAFSAGTTFVATITISLIYYTDL